MSRIAKNFRFRRAENDLYFSYFEEKEDAYEYLKELARRYRHSGRRTNTLKSLCEEAEERGITIYPQFLSKVFKEEFNITVKRPGRPPQSTVQKKFRLEKVVAGNLDALAEKYLQSFYANVIFRMHMGLPVEELVVFTDDDLRSEYVSVLICNPKDEWTGIYFGGLSINSKRRIEEWCYDAANEGLDYLEKKLRVNGHFVIGNTEL